MGWSLLKRAPVTSGRRGGGLFGNNLYHRPRMSLPNVVIVGCGFGGLYAAQGLGKAPVSLTVIDRTNHHLFTPLLYQVATAGLSAPAISAPIRHILAAQRNTTVVLGEVQGIDVKKRTLRLDHGAEFA